MGASRTSRVRAGAAAAFVVALLVGLMPTVKAEIDADPVHEALLAAKQRFGYLIGDESRFNALKSQAVAYAQQVNGAVAGALPNLSKVGSGAGVVRSWQGVDETQTQPDHAEGLSPSDSTGAIGPNGYVEFINIAMAIYDRNGNLVARNPFEKVTGATAHTSMSDPQVIWDAHTNRFYFLIINLDDDTFFWGFSKNSDPRDVSAGAPSSSWCSYKADFGYGSSIPDYPKLGQSSDFLIVGANIYPSLVTYTGSDIDTITKPQTAAPLNTCPAAGSFGLHRSGPILNCDGTPFASDPNPAVQAGWSNEGWVAAVPDATNSGTVGNYVDLIKVTKNPDGSPKIAPAVCVPVPAYAPPAPALQGIGATTVDTLDGRLKHATLAPDPRIVDASQPDGGLALWTSHAVLGGAGSQEDWYEIDVHHASLFQHGTVSDPSLFVYNGGIASDRRATTGTKGKFGSNMVLGVTTSGLTAAPAVQMVSKVGAGPQSGLVLVKQSPGPDGGFDCTQNPVIPGKCRWGDYSGASADPAAPITGTSGLVWLTNMWVTGDFDLFGATWRTWNFAVSPA